MNPTTVLIIFNCCLAIILMILVIRLVRLKAIQRANLERTLNELAQRDAHLAQAQKELRRNQNVPAVKQRRPLRERMKARDDSTDALTTGLLASTAWTSDNGNWSAPSSCDTSSSSSYDSGSSSSDSCGGGGGE